LHAYPLAQARILKVCQLLATDLGLMSLPLPKGGAATANGQLAFSTSNGARPNRTHLEEDVPTGCVLNDDVEEVIINHGHRATNAVDGKQEGEQEVIINHEYRATNGMDGIQDGCEAHVTELKSGTMLVRVYVAGFPDVEVEVDFSERYKIGDLKHEVAKHVNKSPSQIDLRLLPSRDVMGNDDTLLAELDFQGPRNLLCFSAKVSKAIEPQGDLEEGPAFCRPGGRLNANISDKGMDGIQDGCEAHVTELKSGTMLVRVFAAGFPVIEIGVDFSDPYTIGDLKHELAKNMNKSPSQIDLWLQPGRDAMGNDDTLLAELDFHGPRNRLCFSAKVSKAIAPQGDLEEVPTFCRPGGHLRQHF